MNVSKHLLLFLLLVNPFKTRLRLLLILLTVTRQCLQIYPPPLHMPHSILVVGPALLGFLEAGGELLVHGFGGDSVH